jgi:hypothetical protein
MGGVFVGSRHSSQMDGMASRVEFEIVTKIVTKCVWDEVRVVLLLLINMLPE